MIDVYLRTEKKGSNPGAWVSVQSPAAQPVEYYLKYCPGSHLPSGHPFIPAHQPIYEALTYRLVQRLGLSTPECKLLNNNQDLHFITLPGYTGPALNHQMPWYFLSKKLQGHEHHDNDLACNILASQKLYRDLLQLHDLSGSRQNVFFPEDTPQVIYMDLGCSFVDASGGFLTQRNAVTTLPIDRKSNKFDRKYISSRKLHANDGKIIPILDIIDGIPQEEFDVCGKALATLESMLYAEEIDYIQHLLVASTAATFSLYKADPRIEKVHKF